MSDVVTGLRQVVQDLVVPELKAHTARLDALQKQSEMLQKQTEIQFDAMMKRLMLFARRCGRSFNRCERTIRWKCFGRLRLSVSV
jgi:hypothetical protein